MSKINVTLGEIEHDLNFEENEFESSGVFGFSNPLSKHNKVKKRKTKFWKRKSEKEKELEKKVKKAEETYDHLKLELEHEKDNRR